MYRHVHRGQKIPCSSLLSTFFDSGSVPLSFAAEYASYPSLKLQVFSCLDLPS